VPRLGGARHAVLPDRIETGTYAMRVAMAGGDVLLEGGRRELLIDRPRQAAGSRPAPRSRRPTRASASRATATASSPSNGDDRALPRLPDRPAGAVHGADDQGATAPRVITRDDLREPLHARAGTRPPRRAHPALDGQTATRDRRRPPQGRAGHGDRPARLGRRSSSPRSPPRARPPSTASTTSTAASSGSRRSSAAAAPRSSGSAAEGRAAASRDLSSGSVEAQLHAASPRGVAPPGQS
jgi:hypothetical protein